MGFLDKIFHRQQPTAQMQINIFDRNSFLTNEDITKIRQIVKNHYRGPESQTKVVAEIKKTTGLKAGRVTVDHDKSKNEINVYYCCSPC